MDWKLFWTVCGSVFLAEIGDKTQLATLAFTGHSSRPWIVFLAASVALVAATAIGVGAGAWMSRSIPAPWLRRGAALLFIGIGAWMLISAGHGKEA